jgi:hypothetical protein
MSFLLPLQSTVPFDFSLHKIEVNDNYLVPTIRKQLPKRMPSFCDTSVLPSHILYYGFDILATSFQNVAQIHCYRLLKFAGELSQHLRVLR